MARFKPSVQVLQNSNHGENPLLQQPRCGDDAYFFLAKERKCDEEHIDADEQINPACPVTVRENRALPRDLNRLVKNRRRVKPSP